MNKVSPECKDLCNDCARFYISLIDLLWTHIHSNIEIHLHQSLDSFLQRLSKSRTLIDSVNCFLLFSSTLINDENNKNK